MAEVNYHSGQCCGRKCISNFGHIGTEKQTKKWLSSSLQELDGKCKARGLIVEVVLTNGQINQKPYLKEILLDQGFSLVYKGLNRNSGAMLNVFLRHPFPSPIEK